MREGRETLSFLSFLPRRERPLLAGNIENTFTYQKQLAVSIKIKITDWKKISVTLYFVKQLNKGQGTVPTLNAVLRDAGYFAITLGSYLTSKDVK